MPLLKADKKKLAKQYLEKMQGATNIVILSHEGIPVNEMNAVRMDIADAQGVLQSVKKRVLLKAVDGNYDGLTEEALQGSVMVIYSHNEDDQHAPLKVIAKHKKIWKKEKNEFGFDFVGGWYDNAWQGADFVTELANLPGKEELIGKFLFLLQYPISSFARGLQAIADKDGEA
jgi:large subunit ribosomal protein L10